MIADEEPVLISRKEVQRIIPLSRAQLDRLEKDGKFPRRVPYGFRRFWVKQEILAHARDLIAKR